MRRWQIEKPGWIIVLGVLVGPAIAAVPAVAAVLIYSAAAAKGFQVVLEGISVPGMVAAAFQLVILAIPAMIGGVLVGFLPGFFSACLLLVFSGLRPLTFIEQIAICMPMPTLFGMLVSLEAAPGWGPILLFSFAGVVGAAGAILVARARGIVVPVEPGPGQTPASP